MILKPTRNAPARFNTQEREILQDAHKALAVPARRMFMKRSLSLGALTMLTGCSLQDDESVEKALQIVSGWNDKAQALLFDPQKMAPTYDKSQITRPFPFNAYYGEDEIRPSPSDFRLKVSGLVADQRAWTLDELLAFPQTDQITRHICVERDRAMGRRAVFGFSAARRR